MSPDELKERHEALTTRLEMITHDIDQHTLQLKADGEHIHALARIAEAHDVA